MNAMRDTMLDDEKSGGRQWEWTQYSTTQAWLIVCKAYTVISFELNHPFCAL